MNFWKNLLTYCCRNDELSGFVLQNFRREESMKEILEQSLEESLEEFLQKKRKKKI